MAEDKLQESHFVFVDCSPASNIDEQVYCGELCVYAGISVHIIT